MPLYESKGYAGANRFVDEAPYAAATREWVGNLDGCLIDAREVSPIQGVRRYLEVLDEPGHAAGNAFWLMALQERAQRDGFGTLLTGQGGNATISWTGDTTAGLWPLIRQQGWGQVMDALRRDVASGRDPTLRRAFRRELLWPIYYPLLSWRDRLRHLGRPDWEDYAAINPRFAADLNLRQRMREGGHDPAFSPPRDPLQYRFLILQPAHSILGALWAVQAGAFGLEMRDPTLDQRVVEYCLGLPDEQFHRDGQDRWLIRRAMEGQLPPQVLWNTQRGLQAADVGRRTLDHPTEMEETLAALERAPLAREALDLAKMRRVWRALQERVDRSSSTQCGTILLRGIMVGLFLLRFEGGTR